MIRLTIIVLLCMVSVAFAAPKEEVESHFQQGLRYAQTGMADEAIKEFQAVVEADPSNLPRDYYVQTYSEAFFDMGMTYAKRKDNEKAAENFKKALGIFPEHKRALYYLAYTFMNLGEYAEAKSYYARAKQLGITEKDIGMQDIIGDYLGKFQEKKLTIQYQSVFDSTNLVSISIKGVPCGDENLIRDTIGGIEKYSKIRGYNILTPISVERIRTRNDETVIIEKWIVGQEGNQKVFWIKYNFNPPAGFPDKIMIEVSGQEYLS